VPIGQNFSAFLDTFTKTGGFQNLMDFIYNSVGSTNGIDAFGHFVRSNLQLTSCVEVASTVQSGCEAFFRPSSTPAPTKKKKSKKAKKSVRKAHARLRSLPLPPINVPDLSQLLPPSPQPEGQAPPDEPAPAPGSDSGTTTTTPERNAPTDQAPGKQAVSMKSAAMFLNFLLGDGA
jgi:hypothetical protein